MNIYIYSVISGLHEREYFLAGAGILYFIVYSEIFSTAVSRQVRDMFWPVFDIPPMVRDNPTITTLLNDIIQFSFIR